MPSPTSITVTVDKGEYSRFETDTNKVTATISLAGSTFTGESVTIYLVKARRNRDVAVAYQTVAVPDGSAPKTVTSVFNLPEIVDLNNANRVRRGPYFVKAVSVSNPTVIGTSIDFNISLITVANFKRDFLNGLDLRSLNIFAPLTVLNQPVNITGVTVQEVAAGHPQIWAKLSYNYSTDGIDPAIQTLSWCGGPLVTLSSSRTNYTLRGSGDSYINIIVNFNGLPTASHEEDLLVIRSILNDESITKAIDEAISWVEDDVLSVYLEPTVVVSEIDLTTVSYDSGTDIPTFNLADWDKTAQPLVYYAPKGLKWINFRMNNYPLIQFFALYGKISSARVVDINLDWIQAHEAGGWVELVPFNQSTAFNFLGVLWTSVISGAIPIPNFWNYKALLGFRDTPRILIELVGKKAAIGILVKLGQAFRTGISSQGIGRDGVSESVSFWMHPFGVYGAVINNYQTWIDTNLPTLRGAFRGTNLLVV